MRKPRALMQGHSFYHCTTRVVDGGPTFDDLDKTAFVGVLRRLEIFSGIRVLTYCIMDDHVHLLLENPGRENLPPLSAEELFERLPLLYDEMQIHYLSMELEDAREDSIVAERDFLDRFESRRANLSSFLKQFKLRLSAIANRRRGRRGTLWQSRFKSLIIEPSEPYLLMTAAYIDLNPVRAGLVERPEEYRWSGYGEACGGGRAGSLAREGLCSLLHERLAGEELAAPWETFLGRYAPLLDPRKAADQVADRGKAEGGVGGTSRRGQVLPLAEALRRRVRYFSDGFAIGSPEFLEELFQRMQKKGYFSEKRATGPRRMRGADWKGAHVLRDLQRDVIGPPR
jgi:putative transposase